MEKKICVRTHDARVRMLKDLRSAGCFVGWVNFHPYVCIHPFARNDDFVLLSFF
ncbi:hypothetical protein DM02DRAFT_615758 [Periconia macrospinosa]|uniref:Uncharacterized protein n=1 Tax=Periconia macrospinosa TaxID=97972 RepID=A0A2V1DN44_9PLEO|nr:hypothetical protein DM02DRAFT_615758 [Periconia macrospinosa]